MRQLYSPLLQPTPPIKKATFVAVTIDFLIATSKLGFCISFHHDVTR